MSRNSFTDRQKEMMYLSQKGKCGDCQILLDGEWYEYTRGGLLVKKSFSAGGDIHHIIPLSLGGKHKKENWILLCSDCHKKRHARLRNESAK